MSGLKKYRENAAELVSKMTLSEKAELVSGFSMWETRAAERLCVKKADMADGPHGIRKQLDYYDIAVDESVQTVGFPAGCCIASSWDTDALFTLGKTLGKTAKLHNISLLLGPGVNIKRSPLCGRNFEYFSEDPLLSGALGAAYIQGVQSEGVSASVKHFAGNNQETRRLTVNAVIDERALREIYLPAFETCVTEGDADVVMGAYNTLNGDSCTQNKRLLTEILREEWGFDGMVVSDWGAVTNDPAAVCAGCDLKMPGFAKDPEKIVAALAGGALTEAALDKAAGNVTAFLLKAEAEKNKRPEWGAGAEDLEGNHALARRLAAESIVLLKNTAALPLKKAQKLLVVGEFAQSPHFQGGGSSRVNVYKIDSTLELLKKEGFAVRYVPDFSDREAILDAAKGCDTALVFAGTPEAEDSEGFDRTHIELPAAQNAAIAALCGALPTAVVLFDGSAVAMPWAGEADAILEAYLPGEAGGAAVFDILTGQVNPCGKLAETFPVKLEDNSAHLHFPGVRDTSLYGDSIFVGYRYYDKKKIEPLFPFGHGLSYTSFQFGAVHTAKEEYLDNEEITLVMPLTNTGKLPGKEVVQLYIAPLGAPFIRPEKELRAFQKIALAPGETKEVRFTLNARAFAWYDADIADWRVDTGAYEIRVGSSSADFRSTKRLQVLSTRVEKKVFTRDTLMEEVWETAVGRLYLEDVLAKTKTEGKTGEKDGDAAAYMKMVLAMPIKTLILIGMPAEEVDGLIAQLNGGAGDA